MPNQPLAKDKKTDYFWVDSRKLIEEEGYNERENWGDLKGLAQSILAQGVQQALIVNKKGDTYSVKSGNRRRRACKILEEMGHVIMVPVILERRGISPERRVLHQVIDNGGLSFTVWEQAKIAKRMDNFSWSPEQTAQEWGVSATYVRRLLTLVEAPQRLINLVRGGTVTGTFAMDMIAQGRVEELIQKAEEKALPASATDTELFPGEMEVIPQKPVRVTPKDLAPNSWKIFRKWAPKVDEKELSPEKAEFLHWLQKMAKGELTEKDFKKFFK